MRSKSPPLETFLVVWIFATVATLGVGLASL